MKYAKTLKENLQLVKEHKMKSFKESLKESKILKEDVWYDYYDKIEDIDFNPKTGTSKYNTRKELEVALKKAYGWDVNKPAIKEAINRYFETDVEESKKLTESWMPDSETISWLKDYLRDVKRGEGWVNIDKVVYDADIELNKDFSKNKKDLADYIKRIGGVSILKEATSNLREGFGELEVYTSFGPGFGVQIYPSRNGELTVHVGYVSNGSGNGSYKKELKTETELKAQDQIKVSDLKQIERVLKKHLDALDSDLEKTLKQLGYK